MTAKNWQRKNAKIYAPEYLGISDVLIGGGVGKVMSMYREMRDAVLTEGIAMENADADLVLAEEATLELLSVFAKGVLMIHEKEVFVKGTFE